MSSSGESCRSHSWEFSLMQGSQSAVVGRVEMWRGGLRFCLSVAAPFVWRCLNSLTITPFPHPAHQTGHAELPHPAFEQELTPSHTKGHPQITRSTAQGRVPRRASTKRSAYNRQCHHLGGHSLPGSKSGFFLRFSMWHLPQRLHINGVS